MRMIDEKVDEDHFVEVLVKRHEIDRLLKNGVCMAKIIVNEEVISFALILDEKEFVGKD